MAKSRSTAADGRESRASGPAPPLHGKLALGRMDDPLEREADRVADQVMGMPAPKPAVTPTAPVVSRKCAECEEEERNRSAFRSSGQPLDAATRAYFEPRFGAALSGVRLHTDASAHRSAAQVNARAFARGMDVFYASGERPGMTWLTAHELTHVAQNAQSGDRHVIRRAPDDKRPAGGGDKYKIVSDVWVVEDDAGNLRPVLVVESDGQRQAFYKRTGKSDRPEGHGGPQAGEWAPFDGFEETKSGSGRFQKDIYHAGKMADNPLHGYGDSAMRRMAKWLDKLDQEGRLPKGSKADWRYVQYQLQDLGVEVLTRLEKPAERLAPQAGELTAKEPGRPRPIDTQRASMRKPGSYQGVTSGELVKGEITTPKAEPPKPAGGEKPPPKAPPPGPEISRGAIESTAAAGQEATTGAVGGAAMMIHQGQVQNLQNYEQQKAEAAFKKIEPIVDRLTAQGSWVAVKFYFDAPKAPNLLSGVFKEQSDISRFLWISYHSGDTKEEALGEPVAKMDVAPLDIYEAPKNPLGKDRTGSVAEVRVFPPDPNPQPTMMGHPNFVGTYSPDHVDQDSVGGRFDEMVATGMHRSLRFHAGSAAVPSSVVEMWHVDFYGTKQRYETEWVSGNDPSKGISARFADKSRGKTFYTMKSNFKHAVIYGSDNLLFEYVSGDSNVSSPGTYSWSAMIVWKQKDNSA